MHTHSDTNSPVSPLDLAALVEQRIHDSLSGLSYSSSSESAFHLDCARLYGVNVGAHAGTDELMLSFVLEHGDIYHLLDTPESACARLFDAAALVTCGWAAPVSDEDGGEDSQLRAPSEHPERRRVRLVVVVGDTGVGSVLRFEDDADNPIYDAGAARGPLAEAIANFWCDSSVVASPPLP